MAVVGSWERPPAPAAILAPARFCDLFFDHTPVSFTPLGACSANFVSMNLCSGATPVCCAPLSAPQPVTLVYCCSTRCVLGEEHAKAGARRQMCRDLQHARYAMCATKITNAELIDRAMVSTQQISAEWSY